MKYPKIRALAQIVSAKAIIELFLNRQLKQAAIEKFKFLFCIIN
jgi:uncharacterized membrane protein (DUF2068 family)